MAAAFSDRGDAPTDYERELFEQYADDEPRHVRQLWLLIGQRIGLDALCVVLDELGGMHNMSAPTRERFFADLALIERDDEIEQRMQTETPQQIALALRMRVRMVQRRCAIIRVRRRSNRGTRRGWTKSRRASPTP